MLEDPTQEEVSEESPYRACDPHDRALVLQKENDELRGENADLKHRICTLEQLGRYLLEDATPAQKRHLSADPEERAITEISLEISVACDEYKSELSSYEKALELALRRLVQTQRDLAGMRFTLTMVLVGVFLGYLPFLITWL